MPTFADLRPLTADLPPIVLLSSLDFGGAGIAARRLLEGLLAAGADARMICLQKKSNLPQVGELKHPQTGQPLWNYDCALRQEVMRNYPHRPAGFEMFSLTKSLVNLADFEIIKKAGLVHLHWVAGLVGWPQEREVLQNKPVVWTVRDMNPFTGGCHYSAGCEKWKTEGCQSCPQLGTPAPTVDYDLAAANFVNKYDGYQGLNLNVVTISRQFEQLIGDSLLLKNYPRAVIHNGYSAETFAAPSRENARAAFKFPQDKKVILFVADDVKRRNKGFYLLSAALDRLRETWSGNLPLLAIVGMPPPQEILPKGYDCCLFGPINEKQKLTAVYAAADVFVSASLQEAFGNVTAEAQAAGTPGIVFADTGGADTVIDGITGFVVKHPGLPLADSPMAAQAESVVDLAAKIKQVLTMPAADYEKMRKNCRQNARTEFRLELQVERHLQLYRRLLGLPEISTDELNRLSRLPRIAMIAPNIDAASETFIRAQRDGLCANLRFYSGVPLPTHCDGRFLLPTGAQFLTNDLARYVAESFRREQIQIVFAQFGIIGAAVFSICRHLSLPLIVHFHGADASSSDVLRQYGAAYREMFGYASRIIAVSQAMKKRLIELGAPAEKIVVNPCVAADEFFTVQPHCENSQTFLAAGRFVAKKAPQNTLRAFAQVLTKYPEARLILAGGGELRQECIELAKKLGVGKNVEFPGVFTREQLKTWQASALAFVQHSVTAPNGDSEGTPVGILEAGAAGLPVISTRHAGIPEVVIENETGFLVDEHDVDGMARYMLRLLENPAEAAKMGAAAREHLRANFSMARHLAVLDEAVATALAAFRREPPTNAAQNPAEKIVATRDEMVEFYFPKNSVGMEIGVFRGEFSEFLLTKLAPRMLYLVDPFPANSVHSGDKDGANIVTVENMREFYLRTLRPKFEPLPNVKLLADFSANVLGSLPDETLDWIYIDGDHSYRGCASDLELAARKVKKGGIIAGHDYCERSAGVMRAVNEFCQRHNFSLAVKTRDGCPSWLIRNEQKNGKNSDDDVCENLGFNRSPHLAISVIVPVYNVEKYLRECLDSILAQTFTDFELILVDDCSPDASGKICDEYAAKDRRVKVIHQSQNIGSSLARKAGLDAANGVYIQFIDSDDRIESEMFATMFNMAVGGGYDFLLADWWEQRTAGAPEIYLTQKPTSLEKIDLIKDSIAVRIKSGLPHRLFARDLLRKVNFPVCCAAEDYVISMQCIIYAERIGYINRAFYHYRFNPSSLAHNVESATRRWLDLHENWSLIVEFLKRQFSGDLRALEPELSTRLTNLERQKPMGTGQVVNKAESPLTFADLCPLTDNLPMVITLSAADFINEAPNLATQIHFGLVKSGANTQMVTLWKKTNIPTIGELQNNGKPLYHFVRGTDAALNAHFDLSQIADLLNSAGVIHFFDIRGLVDFPTAAPLLRGKKIVWTLENILQLADADALTAVGEPPLNIVITTPTDELAAQVKQHPTLKNFPVIAIPSGDDDRSRMTALTLYLQLYRHFLGLPEKIIMPEALIQQVSAPMQTGAIGDALALYDAHRRNLAINQPSAALAEFDELIAQMKELLAKQKLAAAPVPTPAISVLVPVYKVEQYLRKCLDSILAQTFTDFELIVVDDASPDNCGKICDEYAAKDPRIKVIHKPQNEGLPQARKTGFVASRGAYIQFADSDDWLEPDMLAKMFYAAVSGDGDLVYSDYWEHRASADGTITQEYANLGRSIDADKITNINECVLHRSKTARWNCVVWNKLYRRSVIAAIEFPTASRAEDHYITCQTLYYANKIAYTPFALYHYQRQNTQSIMNDAARAEKNYREQREIFTQVEQFLREKFGEDFTAFEPTVKQRMAEVERQKTNDRPGNHVYNENFYAKQVAGSLRSAKTVLPLVVNLIKPQSVCDVGCGTGAWLKTCAEIAGITDENTIGFDFDVPASQLLIKQQQYRNTDLKIPVVCERKFDLCISVEVAEHIPHKQSEIFVQSLVDLAPVILFSAAVPGQGGTEHINEQWPLYWEQIFRKKNYYGIDLLRSQIWDNNRIDWWYRQNIVLFVREDKLAELGLEKPQSLLLPFVHPQSKQWRRAELQPVGIINPDTIPLHRDVFGPYKNCFQGKDCVVLGTGPTLNSYQPLKDAIHIGVNGAVLYNKVNLDYYFMANYLAVKDFFEKVEQSSARKFFAHYIDNTRRERAVSIEKCVQNHAHIFCLRPYWSVAEMQLFESQGGELNPDLLNCPMVLLDGSATMGIQFALWGNAKRIFLVGCDGVNNSSPGLWSHFYNMAPVNERGSQLVDINMRKIKELRDKHYPDTEIISINPVQYKGLFDKDIYTVKDSTAIGG